MNKLILNTLSVTLVFVLTLLTLNVQAVTGRNPTGVNVNANGVTTVHITFHNLEPNEVPVDAFWCGDVTSSGVVIGTNPCVSGTLLGHLPKQFDFASTTQLINLPGTCPFPLDTGLCPPSPTLKSGLNQKFNKSAGNNLTDIMTIPTAVIRRAYQEAQRGESSEFFYIRQFSNNGVNTYVTVTCRMSGGGARVPLALTKVDLNFDTNGYRRAITQVKQGTQVPKWSVKINYNGTGLLKGRWEIVKPGEEEPTAFDLLSEASLSAAERPLQKRYSLISRFQKFLPPTGNVTIAGPDPRLISTLEKGLYRILLRIEASNDKEGNTDTTEGILNTGGVAGFSMPTLRYFVGEISETVELKSLKPVSLLLPVNNQSTDAPQLKFSWFDLDSDDVVMYRIELYRTDGNQDLVLAAYVKPGVSSYAFDRMQSGIKDTKLLWKVIALDEKGNERSSSKLRIIELLD